MLYTASVAASEIIILPYHLPITIILNIIGSVQTIRCVIFSFPFISAKSSVTPAEKDKVRKAKQN